jgi:hypothetical protein
VCRPGSSRPSGRIWNMFAVSAERVIAEARIVRVNRACPKQRSARRRPVWSRQRVLGAPPQIDDHGGVAVADVELDQLLTGRGWVEFERVDGLTMYDWPPSAPNGDHEITYLIVDLRGAVRVGPSYRVSVVDGDRLMYEVKSELVADLDTIEASRCTGCTRCPDEAAG